MTNYHPSSSKFIHQLHLVDQSLMKSKSVDLKTYEVFRKFLSNVLYEIQTKYGTPQIEEDGLQTVKEFSIMVKHTENIPLMKKVVEELLGDDRSSENDSIPLILDRLTYENEKKQLYGTIFKTKKNKEGEIIIIPGVPIKDKNNVDNRRAKYGLMSLENYIEHSKKFYKEVIE